MARRKQVAEEAARSTPIDEAAPRAAMTAADDLEPPEAEQPARPWRADPFPVKTVNLDGYKLQLQESRKSDAGWQMQIKFGDGGKDDMPSGDVRDFIKSCRITVRTKSGEEKEVPMFHWNDRDRAWGMGIDFDSPASARTVAAKVFNEVVDLVAQERGAGGRVDNRPARQPGDVVQPQQGAYAMSDTSKTEKPRQPVHKLKDGAIEVAIWLNEGTDGPFYSITHRRIYKKGDAWKESGTYGQDDLLALAKLLDLAHTWCLVHSTQRKARSKAA